MAQDVRIAFERRVVVLPLAALLPRKMLPDRFERTVKYKRIARSIQEVGIIEPLVVARLQKKRESQYLLLDGHVRLAALTELGQTEARCLIADDDEAFTYNKRVNRLATVQEHFMLTRAIKRGVSEEKLAKALNVDIKLIKRRRTLLDGICPEAVELLKDKSVNPVTFDVLRKMKPMRQIEAAELMATAGNWSSSYAKALLAATKQEDLAKPDQPKKIAGLTPEQMARMEREMSSLHQDFKQIESSYGDDILHLVIASGYLAKLVGNKEVERYLDRHHAEILSEFRAIIAATSLDQTQSMAA
jgi:ParB-like chromosome segregation protein Spo0J